MAKKRQSSQSVRRNAKRRQEEARQRRNSQIRTAALIVVVLLALVGGGYLLFNLLSSEQSSADDANATDVASAESDAQATLTPTVEAGKGDQTPEATVAPVQNDQTEVDFGEPGPLAALAPADRANYFSQPPEMSIDPSKEYDAVIRTEKGDMRLHLFAAESPQTVNNFVFLARQGFYDGTIFHRVIDGFMAQGGDPTGTGAGGPGYAFADEVSNGLVFDRPGLLAMANSGPNTNGSQFFITYVETPWLNGQHTIFGELIDGHNVLDSLSRVEPGSSVTPQGDKIERIAIIES